MSSFSKNEVHFRRKKVDVLRGERGKAKTVQQTTVGAGAAPAPETPGAGDGRRQLRLRRAQPAEPESDESDPEPDVWRPGDPVL